MSSANLRGCYGDGARGCCGIAAVVCDGQGYCVVSGGRVGVGDSRAATGCAIAKVPCVGCDDAVGVAAAGAAETD